MDARILSPLSDRESTHHADDLPVVAVIGMGYVGSVCAAALAKQGCDVIGVERHPTKLARLQTGRSPVREAGLDPLFRQVSAAGRLHGTADLAAAVRDADVIMVAVGTPSDEAGRVDLGAIDRVTEQIALALNGDRTPRTVMIRSTVPPGTTRLRIAPVLHGANPHLRLCHHPEFLREGTALRDWFDPPMIVFGADGQDHAAVEQLMRRIYHGIDARLIRLDTIESELTKYACNVFHALKIDFANEVGSIARSLGADGARVMQTLCQDTRLNLSPAYLRPGFAFGGSCLPKDTRGLTRLAQDRGVRTPVIGSILESNVEHLQRQVDRVLAHGRGPAVMLGLSFKNGTDDLRESPMAALAAALARAGVRLAVYDPDLDLEELLGTNLGYLREHLNGVELIEDRDELARRLSQAETVVVTKPIEGVHETSLAGKTVIDLTCLPAVAGDPAMVEGRAAASRAA